MAKKQSLTLLRLVCVQICIEESYFDFSPKFLIKYVTDQIKMKYYLPLPGLSLCALTELQMKKS